MKDNEDPRDQPTEWQHSSLPAHSHPRPGGELQHGGVAQTLHGLPHHHHPQQGAGGQQRQPESEAHHRGGHGQTQVQGAAAPPSWGEPSQVRLSGSEGQSQDLLQRRQERIFRQVRGSQSGLLYCLAAKVF